MENPSPHEGNLRRPHPLTAALIERLRMRPRASVLELGCGRGRNTAALVEAGFAVDAVADEHAASFTPAESFDAALSTHALLHGTRSAITSMLRALAAALEPGAAFYAAFASQRDARYGSGIALEKDVFAPESGDERGVAHAYFDEPGVRDLLEPDFVIESLEEHNVDSIVGSWAHSRRPHGSVHWFVQAVRR